MTAEQQCLSPPEQSAFPWESECEMIAGFCDCRQTCYWSLPLRFCWPSREREEKTLQDFPSAHTHTHTHTLKLTHTHTHTQSPFTTVLQFPELLNSVIISLPLSCPLTAPWLSFPTPHSRASLAPLCKTKPPCSEVTLKSPAPTRASLITHRSQCWSRQSFRLWGGGGEPGSLKDTVSIREWRMETGMEARYGLEGGCLETDAGGLRWRHHSAQASQDMVQRVPGGRTEPPRRQTRTLAKTQTQERDTIRQKGTERAGGGKILSQFVSVLV